jgi:hypothetical protein
MTHKKPELPGHIRTQKDERGALRHPTRRNYRYGLQKPEIVYLLTFIGLVNPIAG